MRSPRRWFRIGPGLVLALVASYFVWRSGAAPEPPARRSSPVTKGHASVPIPPPPAAPELGFVLERRSELGLSPRQVRSVTALERRWRAETAELRAALERAAREFDDGMGRRTAQRDTLPGLQQRLAATSQYSRELHAARRAAWEEAAGLLTARQRQEAEALWHARMTGRLGPGTAKGLNPLD